MNHLMGKYGCSFIVSGILFLSAVTVCAAECSWDQSNLQRHWKKHGKEIKNINDINEYEEVSIGLCKNAINAQINPGINAGVMEGRDGVSFRSMNSDQIKMCTYQYVEEITEPVTYGIDETQFEVTVEVTETIGIYDVGNSLFLVAILDEQGVYRIKTMFKMNEDRFSVICGKGGFYKKRELPHKLIQ